MEVVISMKIAGNVWTVCNITWQIISKILEAANGRLPYIFSGILFLLIFWLSSKTVKQIFWSLSAKNEI